MAILTKVITIHGEERELYMRLNSVETSNHGALSSALFRGFLSEAAYKEGRHYIHEEAVELIVDVSKPVWEQFYGALKEKYTSSVSC